MRILKTTQAYHPYLAWGGTAVKVKALAELLVRRGHQVTVLTAHYGHADQTETRWIEGVEVVYFGYLARRRALTINHGAVSLREYEEPQDYLLVLAGPDEGDGYLEELKALAKRLGLNGRVRFTGPLYGVAKWTAYRAAHLFVLPSQHENFGNAAAEAIACGTPVIVTDRCRIALSVDGQAGLVVSYGQTALQQSLFRLLHDDSLSEHLRAGCERVARALSWEERFGVVENLYRDLQAEAQPQ